MLLSVVTGFGHFYLRHYVLGAVLFSLFAIGLNGIFLGTVIKSDAAAASRIYHVSIPFTCGVWLLGLIHCFKISYGTDRTRLREERARLFHDGLVAYLRDDLDAAAGALQQAVDRDVDWEGPDALFHLGVVELRRAARFAARGEKRAADRTRRRGLRAFRVCLAHDDRKKWRGEIAQERERANVPVRPPKRRSPESGSEERPASLGVGSSRVTSSGKVLAAEPGKEPRP
jgi:hypothetical protein